MAAIGAMPLCSQSPVESWTCAACHQLVDPVAYGFEEFDALGQYRTTDNGHPVDASGCLRVVEDPGPGPFVGAVELSAKLASSATVRECMTKQWFRFALSRDECSIATATQASSGSLPSMVVAIATSDPFRYARW